MKKTNLFWLIFGVILIVFLAVWLSTDTQRQEIDPDLESNYQEMAEEYVRENISELSPEPEVLGGTFYVTNIDFIEEDMMLVEYEDGHIALEAHAKFSVIDEEIIIDYFRLTDKFQDEKQAEEKYNLVSDYIEQNISELSPEPEVLGGTFYVTNIDFIDSNLAIVEYEDGHIALEAQVVYSVIDNQVNINSFQLIEEQQEEELKDEDLVTSYIEENISELSPEPEVLGGTFYVTNIDFIEDNLILVEYEDGHIALEAQVTYSVVGDQVSIESFQLIEEKQDQVEEVEIEDEDLVTSYIEENISELSPEPEVLGGTFYVTNIDFIEDNLAIVEYEDGHIAFEVRANFFVEDGIVTVEEFDLVD